MLKHTFQQAILEDALTNPQTKFNPIDHVVYLLWNLNPDPTPVDPKSESQHTPNQSSEDAVERSDMTNLVTNIISDVVHTKEDPMTVISNVIHRKEDPMTIDLPLQCTIQSSAINQCSKSRTQSPSSSKDNSKENVKTQQSSNAFQKRDLLDAISEQIHQHDTKGELMTPNFSSQTNRTSNLGKTKAKTHLTNNSITKSSLATDQNLNGHINSTVSETNSTMPSQCCLHDTSSKWHGTVFSFTSLGQSCHDNNQGKCFQTGLNPG